MANKSAINSPESYLSTVKEVEMLEEQIEKLKTEKKEALDNLSAEQKAEIKKFKENVKNKTLTLKEEKDKLATRKDEISKSCDKKPFGWRYIIAITIICFGVCALMLERLYPTLEEKDAVSPIFFAICVAVLAVMIVIRMIGAGKIKTQKATFDKELLEISARLSAISEELDALPDEKDAEGKYLTKNYDKEIDSLKSRIKTLKKDMAEYSTNKKLRNHIFVYIGTYSAKPNENYYGRYGSISQARVTIDGADLGSTRTLCGFAVTPGRHTISVEVYEESNEIYGNSDPETFYVNDDYQVYFYRLNTYNQRLSLRTYDDINEFKRDSRLTFNVSDLVK